VSILRYVSVHDCGTMLNPKIVEGQHLGALVHGFGGALFEQFSYASDGTPLNRHFREYLIPTAADVPELVLVLDHLITPNPFTPGGFKGAGRREPSRRSRCWPTPSRTRCARSADASTGCR
jgi:CO/xanthine dehydrogenase Mo-binding subunit